MIDWADLEARNAPLNAFVDWDSAATAGTGPLAGVTVGVKSNIAVAGLPHTAGMATRRGLIAAHDAEVVRRLRAAGAVVLGSLNMHEAALGATTDNAWYGRTHNPHRRGHTPGGSSGGSGAVIAAGLCDVALGTDTLGSVRIPAAYNGVYGLKPTNGAVPDEGLVFLEPGLDCIGPLARDLDLLERVFSVMAGAPTAIAPLTRLILLRDLNGVEVEPGVRAGHDRARAAIDLPASELTLTDDATAIRMAGLIEAVRYLLADLGERRRTEAHLLSDELKFILDMVGPLPRQPDVLAHTRATLRDALGDDGVLLLPTTPQVAFQHGRAPATQADFTALANIAGLPALACPAGRDADGLPVSIQLVGPPGSDRALIALARTLEPALGGAVLPKGT